MRTNTTYSTREVAERFGNAEAAIMTARGYPTVLIEVREVKVNILHLDGQSPSEMKYVSIECVRYEAVLSE